MSQGQRQLEAVIATLDRQLAGFSRWQILTLSICGVATVGALDYLTGYELSVTFFYLLPVAIASWYAGRGASVSIAALSCALWYSADLGAGHTYQNSAIPLWNASIRFMIFVVNGLLLVALRDSLFRQRDLARTDALTGVCGRRAFEDRLEHDLALARRNGRPLTIAFLDLDDFKVLNDRRGHVVGDQVLRATALALQSATRNVDMVARLGGDEFALVLPDTPGQGAEELVAKLMREVRHALGAVAPEVTCSVGVITFDRVPPRLEEAVRAADALMYQAKRDGKNRVAFRVAHDDTGIAVQSQGATDALPPARP